MQTIELKAVPVEQTYRADGSATKAMPASSGPFIVQAIFPDRRVDLTGPKDGDKAGSIVDEILKAAKDGRGAIDIRNPEQEDARGTTSLARVVDIENK